MESGPVIMCEITYTPRILSNMREITTTMRVGREKVFKWIEEGAPICVEMENGKPCYSAEAGQLQKWRLERSRAKNRS